ncbi:MAG: terminase small subunit [Pseudomonadota bacterium]
MPNDQTERELTPKQEAFALAYFETGVGSEAYRQAYDVDPDNTSNWVHREASLLLDNPKVAQRVAELQERARQMSVYSKMQALDELEEARLLAMEIKSPSAAVSAINGKTKICGLDAPTEVKHTGSADKPVVVEGIGFDVVKLSQSALKEIIAAGAQAAEEEGAAQVDE